MKTDNEIKLIGKQTITTERDAISVLEKRIGDDFVSVIKLLLNTKGRVIITGIGKSANIATKIVSTLNSTGTPAIFMHAADAIHGDLGIIQHHDVIICVSKSGNTPEIKVLIPLLKNTGNKIIALVGNTDSYLAHQADYILDCTVEREACPNNLAPTSSTTAQLVMGDAIAVTLVACRGFTSEDFAKYHPGGALGKRLYLRVSDLYIKNEKPWVEINSDIRSIIMEITSKRLGCAAVIENNRIVGIITDGDLRRMLQKNQSFDQLTAKDIMSCSPKCINAHTHAVEALSLMRKHSITQLLVVNDDEEYIGVIHLHDLINEGIL